MIVSSQVPSVLDPGHGTSDAQEIRSMLRLFASLPAYRSAVVDELILDRDFYRRPLRPDDLAFIDFSTPLTTATASNLSALAAHRMLLCINESWSVQLPPEDDERRWAGFEEFYSGRNRALGAAIRPFLERHAFAYVAPEPAGAFQAPVGGIDALVDLIDAEQVRSDAAGRHVDAIVGSAGAASLLDRVELVQMFGLAPAMLAACDTVIGGWLSPYEPSVRAARALVEPARSLDYGWAEDRVSAPLRLHSCWQFYLPCAMAVANLMHHLAGGARPFRALGALVFTALHAGSFVRRHERAAGGDEPPRHAGHTRDLAIELVAPLADRYGAGVWADAADGLAMCARAQAQAGVDLTRQVTWLSALEYFCRVAREIQDTIERERLAIDRETFVEPRAMCSTTHVHDDHRLVLVESGEMVFWAVPGMRLTLQPGELVLVPRHRLHGSSVLTDECVYHQPIIPDEWIQSLTADAGYAVA